MIKIYKRKVGAIKQINVENDKDVIKLEFRCENQVTDLIKLTDCTAIYFNYQNGSIKDRYLVTDLKEDGDEVTFSWTLGRNAVRTEGKTFFVICAQIADNGEVLQEWNSIRSSFDVKKGLEVATSIPEEYEDIFTQLVETVNKKMSTSNIKGGDNVTVEIDGADVIINSEGGSASLPWTELSEDVNINDLQDGGYVATGEIALSFGSDAYDVLGLNAGDIISLYGAQAVVLSSNGFYKLINSSGQWYFDEAAMSDDVDYALNGKQDAMDELTQQEIDNIIFG